MRMRAKGWTLLVALAAGPASAADGDGLLDLRKGTVVRFATEAEGREILGKADPFVDAMGPFDRAARLQSTKAVSKKEFLAFARKQVLPWSPEQKADWREAVAKVEPALRELGLPLPAETLVVQTTGREEFDAAYTRGNAVILPRAMARTPGPELLVHELFHVLSRQPGPLRDRCYAVVGFTPCPEVALPGSLADRRITNPDAFTRSHSVEVTAAGEKVRALPVLYSKRADFDPKFGKGLFDYLEFRLMVVDGKDGKWIARQDGKGEPVLLRPEDVPDYLDRVGRNTQYVIHPEEVLADNFALLGVGRKGLPSPGSGEGLR